jgi:hypothetical protein
LALVSGMFPVLLGQGPAAESHRGIAVVIIGGQSMCLLLTLLMTPVAYSLFLCRQGAERILWGIKPLRAGTGPRPPLDKLRTGLSRPPAARVDSLVFLVHRQ